MAIVMIAHMGTEEKNRTQKFTTTFHSIPCLLTSTCCVNAPVSFAYCA